MWSVDRERRIELGWEDVKGQVKACTEDTAISATVFVVSRIVRKKKLWDHYLLNKSVAFF